MFTLKSTTGINTEKEVQQWYKDATKSILTAAIYDPEFESIVNAGDCNTKSPTDLFKNIINPYCSNCHPEKLNLLGDDNFIKDITSGTQIWPLKEIVRYGIYPQYGTFADHDCIDYYYTDAGAATIQNHGIVNITTIQGETTSSIDSTYGTAGTTIKLVNLESSVLVTKDVYDGKAIDVTGELLNLTNKNISNLLMRSLGNGSNPSLPSLLAAIGLSGSLTSTASTSSINYGDIEKAIGGLDDFARSRFRLLLNRDTLDALFNITVGTSSAYEAKYSPEERGVVINGIPVDVISTLPYIATGNIPLMLLGKGCIAAFDGGISITVDKKTHFPKYRLIISKHFGYSVQDPFACSMLTIT